MKLGKESPIIRRKPNSRSASEEIKFIKSFKDLEIFWQKALFVLATFDRNS